MSGGVDSAVAALLLKQAAGILREADIEEVDSWLVPAHEIMPPAQ